MAGELFLRRTRYYLAVEYPTKIRAALLAMPVERVWWRPNEWSNSAGNLVLHLAGNVTQWVVGGIGRENTTRDRDGEFGLREGPGAQELVAHLERALENVDRVLADVKPENLLEEREIQGRATTVLSAIYHVVEHFSMHTGQIVMLSKMFAQKGAVSFYDDARNAAPTFLKGDQSDID